METINQLAPEERRRRRRRRNRKSTRPLSLFPLLGFGYTMMGMVDEELLGGYESDTFPTLPFRVSTRSSHASASVGVTVERDSRFALATSIQDVPIDEEVETTGVEGNLSRT